MFLIYPLMFMGIIIFLYMIHDYLYLPDKIFHVIKLHLLGANTSNSDYQLLYDKIHFLSWNSLEFALIWGVITFVIICLSMQYLKVIKNSQGSKKISLIMIFLSLFISISLYFYTIISNFNNKEFYLFEKYFTYPFTHDLTSDGQIYNKIVFSFHNDVSLWSSSAFMVSLFFLISIFSFYFLLSKVYKMYQKYTQLVNKNIPSKELRSDKFPQNTISQPQEGRPDLNNKATILPDKIVSLHHIETKENMSLSDGNIDPISSENIDIPTAVSTNKNASTKGIKKFKMVNKIGENHTSI